MRNKLLHLPVLVLLFLAAATAAAAATTEVQKEQERISGRIPAAAGTTMDRYGAMECLTVPNSVFASAVLSTMAGISKTLSIVSGFGSYFGDFRVSTAINDCLDLLDLSNDELSRTLSASQTGKSNGTGRTAVDLKTWLSAALFNQDTCIDGFDGTSGFFKQIVAEGLNQVSSLIREVLYMVHDVPGPPASSRGGNAGSGGGGRRLMSDGKGSFPYWISSKDRKLLQTTTTVVPNAVVALDGTGNYTRIMDAVSAAPDHGTTRFVIYVKRGVYNEYVDIKRKKTNIMVYGDGMDATVVTGNRSNAGGWTTYRSATFAVTGSGFIARDLTILNTAGPENHQAVAFRSDSDLSALYRCAFRGYQDTLYTHANRQFYRECTITGTVDFIFGDAVAMFQNCLIVARKGLPNQKNTVTAQGRKDPGEISGFSIQFCNITGDQELLTQSPVNATQTYLGRPWKPYSRTVIMQSYIGNVVMPQGWLEWNGNMSLDTLFYAEWMNSGPGAALGSRGKWPGYHMFNNSIQAMNYTVAEFIGGNLWLPQTGVRYSAGLNV
ncbi:Pectinesterase/pectinesterase inhibitor PPE8B-like protein [Drosera capensis]